MKKNLTILSALVLIFVNSSLAQFAAGYTNAQNVITFKVKPSVAKTTGFSVLEFFVRYPENSPVFTYGTPVANTTDFPGMVVNQTPGQGGWEIDRLNPAFQITGYHVDHIFYTAPAPVTSPVAYNASQEYSVVSIPVNGIAGQTVNFELVDQSTEASFYLALTSDKGDDLRPFAGSLPDHANFFFPTTSQAEGPDGSTVYYSALAVPLPVKFLGFSAIKKDNNAVLSWQVENESNITDRYEIERNINGISFKTVYTISAKNNGKSSNSYTIADLDLPALRSSGIFYYRIRQIDKDNKAVYSETRSVRLNSKELVIAVHPNPVKNLATLSIDLEQDATATLSIMDAAGRQLQSSQVVLFKGLNTKQIDLGAYAAGSYMVKVQTATETKMIPVVKTN